MVPINSSSHTRQHSSSAIWSGEAGNCCSKSVTNCSYSWGALTVIYLYSLARLPIIVQRHESRELGATLIRSRSVSRLLRSCPSLLCTHVALLLPCCPANPGNRCVAACLAGGATNGQTNDQPRVKLDHNCTECCKICTNSALIKSCWEQGGRQTNRDKGQQGQQGCVGS